ncbi:MAG TPA: hypothetical protein VN456_00850 [Desulfosporosinus sp.]|nr:hypothetical protein [Desulfosporosinus sp.]
MLINNREVLFQNLIAGLDELLKLNGIEVAVDIESYAAGFQGIVTHILNLIKTMEEEGSTPREIIAGIKTRLDDGSYLVIH